MALQKEGHESLVEGFAINAGWNRLELFDSSIRRGTGTSALLSNAADVAEPCFSQIGVSISPRQSWQEQCPVRLKMGKSTEVKWEGLPDLPESGTTFFFIDVAETRLDVRYSMSESIALKRKMKILSGSFRKLFLWWQSQDSKLPRSKAAEERTGRGGDK